MPNFFQFIRNIFNREQQPPPPQQPQESNTNPFVPDSSTHHRPQGAAPPYTTPSPRSILSSPAEPVPTFYKNAPPPYTANPAELELLEQYPPNLIRIVPPYKHWELYPRLTDLQEQVREDIARARTPEQTLPFRRYSDFRFDLLPLPIDLDPIPGIMNFLYISFS